jgi:hypothetical protein
MELSSNLKNPSYAIDYERYHYTILNDIRNVRNKLKEQLDFILEHPDDHYSPIIGICRVAHLEFENTEKYEWLAKILWQRYKSQFSPTRTEYKKYDRMYWYFGEKEFTIEIKNKSVLLINRKDVVKWYGLRIDFMDRWIDDIKKRKERRENG